MKIKNIFHGFILLLFLNFPNSVMAIEPIYLKCSGTLHYNNLYLDNSSKSDEKRYENEVLSMTIDSGKVRFDGGVGDVFSLLFPKEEFSICKANEILYFNSFNDQDCKTNDANSVSVSYTEVYSGEYNRILDTLRLSRSRNTYTVKNDTKTLLKSLTSNSEFTCQKIKF